jgi:hypothetical protein
MLRFIEKIRCGRQDEAAHAMLHGALQQVQTVGDILAQIFINIYPNNLTRWKKSTSQNNMFK